MHYNIKRFGCILNPIIMLLVKDSYLLCTSTNGEKRASSTQLILIFSCVLWVFFFWAFWWMAVSGWMLAGVQAGAGVGFQQDWTSMGRVNIQQRQRKGKYHWIVACLVMQNFYLLPHPKAKSGSDAVTLASAASAPLSICHMGINNTTQFFAAYEGDWEDCITKLVVACSSLSERGRSLPESTEATFFVESFLEVQENTPTNIFWWPQIQVDPTYLV